MDAQKSFLKGLEGKNVAGTICSFDARQLGQHIRTGFDVTKKVGCRQAGDVRSVFRLGRFLQGESKFQASGWESGTARVPSDNPDIQRVDA